MKVLFLDIDGVVNSEESFKNGSGGNTDIDPYMAFLVGKIQLETDCKVVLSSSWRHHPDGIKMVEDRVVKIIDKTPFSRSKERDKRGYEIQDWLDAHPEVSRYAIIDDSGDMLEEQMENFFQTTWQKGITEEIMQKIIIHLNK